MANIPLQPMNSLLKNTHDTPDLERNTINSIWGTALTPLEYKGCQDEYSAYFHNTFEDLCAAACSGDTQIPNYKHEQIMNIVALLKQQDKTQNEIAALVEQVPGSSPEQQKRALNLAAGLLVPLNFSGIGGSRPGDLSHWDPSKSLKQLMEDKVKIWSGQAGAGGPAAAPCPTCSSPISFPRRFTAWHLQFLASFKIRWTNNLSDHLLILDNEVDLAVYIFHQVKVLELHRTLPSKIMTEDLILETFDTLALLFPRTDRKARLWYQQLQEKYNLDPGVFRCTYIKMEDCEIRHFKHWGPRLLKIKRAFDDHEPNGPVQWWRDDRKPVQWWTFWTAVLVLVLTVVFGMIQSVASILQVIHG